MRCRTVVQLRGTITCWRCRGRETVERPRRLDGTAQTSQYTTLHIYTVHSTEQSMPRLDCSTISVWFADGRSFGVCNRVLLDSQLDLLLGDRSGLAHRVRWTDQQQQRNEQQVRKG